MSIYGWPQQHKQGQTLQHTTGPRLIVEQWGRARYSEVDNGGGAKYDGIDIGGGTTMGVTIRHAARERGWSRGGMMRHW